MANIAAYGTRGKIEVIKVPAYNKKENKFLYIFTDEIKI